MELEHASLEGLVDASGKRATPPPGPVPASLPVQSLNGHPSTPARCFGASVRDRPAQCVHGEHPRTDVAHSIVPHWYGTLEHTDADLGARGAGKRQESSAAGELRLPLGRSADAEPAREALVGLRSPAFDLEYHVVEGVFAPVELTVEQAGGYTEHALADGPFGGST
jgi:hypothetical protein